MRWNQWLDGSSLFVPEIRSDGHEWQHLPTTKQALACKRTIYTFNTKWGRKSRYQRPCDSWTHSECAEQLARLIAGHAACRFEMSNHIWVAHLQGDPSVLRRTLHQPRRRLSKDLQRDVCYTTVAREEGSLWIFTDGDLGLRRRDKHKWIPRTPQEAINTFVKVAMVLPGLQTRDAVTWSEGWKPEPPKPTYHGVDLKRFAAKLPVLLSDVSDEYRRRTGDTPPAIGRYLPDQNADILKHLLVHRIDELERGQDGGWPVP